MVTPRPTRKREHQRVATHGVIVSFAVTLLGIANGWAADVDARVDRNPVAVNESFRLSFEVDDKGKTDPDFSVLEKEFEILGRSRRSNLSVTNGKVTRSTTWLVNLIARQAGSFTIPPVSFGDDKSEPIRVTVEAAPSASSSQRDPELFLEVDAQPKEQYVQAQVVYTVRLWRDTTLEMNAPSLSDPKLSGAEAVIEQLGKDKIYDAERGGKPFIVVERNYAVFPQQSGRVTVEPTVFQAQIIRGSQSLFDPLGQSVGTRRLQSDPIGLRVKPVPQTFKGKHWLPARELQIREFWSNDPPRFTLGQPVTRTVAMLARGLTAGQLPELIGGLPDGIRGYPDQPVVDDQKRATGVTGIRQEKLAVIPSRAGKYTLPAIEIPWWNTETDTLETARLPAREIAVAGEVTAEPPEAIAGAPAPLVPQPRVEAPAPAGARPDSLLWPRLSAVLALGWLATTIGWWRSGRLQRIPAQLPWPGRDSQRLLRRVREACGRSDPVLAKEALLDWARARWPERPPASVGELATRCDGGSRHELERLNRCLYGRAPEPWEGSRFWQALQEWDSIKSRQGALHPLAPLEPLYKS